MKKITIKDKEYPEQLKIIPNPPRILYLEGNTELLKQKAIAIIGSRNSSENGEKLAKKFASELSEQGLVIVSGMAKGIDTSAHKGCLEAKGRTIAVLGNGFKHIFPKENINLYKEIINNGGLIVSEYSPEIVARSCQFLERNRIVSGLSIGVLVVEAAYRSGTSVTAKHAIKQKRKVFVLPHEIEDMHGVGTNNLIKRGGILITSTKEIIEQFDFLKYKKIETTKIIEKNKKQEIKKFKDKGYEEIYNLILAGINKVNEISKITNKTINETSNILLMLEIEGAIKKVSGGYTCT